jgi:hypothetical protein
MGSYWKGQQSSFQYLLPVTDLHRYLRLSECALLPGVLIGSYSDQRRFSKSGGAKTGVVFPESPPLISSAKLGRDTHLDLLGGAPILACSNKSVTSSKQEN